MDRLKDSYQLSYRQVDDPPVDAPKARPLSSAQQGVLQFQTSGFWASNWTLEILSCILSVASLVGIIIILYVFNGQSMPDWPYGVTLNALISLLITVMKAAMAFPVTEALSQLKWSWFSRGNKLSDLALLDAASRGAVGAVMVLFQFIPRYLVTFGCLILVITAAIPPFIQQVIAINLRSVESLERSSIQICNSSTYTDYVMGAGPGMNLVPLTTTGAIYTGIFQSQSPNSNSLTVTCPTGNCTFPTYQSLGFCSRCANITNLLTLNTSGMDSLSEYNYTLPNGLSFNTAINMEYLLNSSTNVDLLQLDTKGMSLILNFTAITGAGYGAPPQISATECALYFCIDTYESSVKGGQFTEKLISTTSSSNYSTQSFSTENLAITPEACYVNGTEVQPPYDGNDNCTYSVNWLSQLAMYNSLAPLLQGNGSLFVSNRPYWSSDTVRAAYGTFGNYTDINLIFNSLVSALTTHARSKVCDASVNGTTWEMESYVYVRWPWMILPIVLLMFSIVFFIATVIKTRNQYIWKSSPLALLFSDVSVEAPHSLPTNPSLSGMEKMSRKMNVWLETSSLGVKLKGIPG